jgi:hypothetical protein
LSDAQAKMKEAEDRAHESDYVEAASLADEAAELAREAAREAVAENERIAQAKKVAEDKAKLATSTQAVADGRLAKARDKMDEAEDAERNQKHEDAANLAGEAERLASQAADLFGEAANLALEAASLAGEDTSLADGYARFAVDASKLAREAELLAVDATSFADKIANLARTGDTQIASQGQDPVKNAPAPLNPVLLGVGVTFLLIIIGIAVYIPKPTEFQFLVFRSTLAISIACVAASVPGFLEVGKDKGALHAAGIQAGGAMAVFIVVYMLNPMKKVLPTKDDVEPPEQDG